MCLEKLSDSYFSAEMSLIGSFWGEIFFSKNLKFFSSGRMDLIFASEGVFCLGVNLCKVWWTSEKYQKIYLQKNDPPKKLAFFGGSTGICNERHFLSFLS